MRELRIILSCTARKRASDTGFPRLCNVSRAPVSERVKQWVARVSSAPRRHAAGHLYAGEYWQTGMRLASLAKASRPTSVSVISAGLGLVGLEDEVPMYGATFTARHADSVLTTSSMAGHSQVRRQWWHELTRAEVLGRTGPCRLADLEKHESDTDVLVSVGREYVDAVEDDLVDLADRLSDPERMMIFAAGSPSDRLEKYWVSVPGNLRLALGGSMSSINLRAASKVFTELEDWQFNIFKARCIVDELAAKAEDLPHYNRRRLSDRVIKDWIIEQLTEFPEMSKTTALRQFRDGGNACEQSRFGRLFETARAIAT